MIRNEKEYAEAAARLEQEKRRLAEQESRLRSTGLKSEQVKRVMDPLRSFHQQLVEEVENYQRLKRGELDEMRDLRGLGQLLVSLRIARGMTQRDLAERLGVHETQVSRDERNEYHGITVERAARVLEALGAQVHGQVELVEPKAQVA